MSDSTSPTSPAGSRPRPILLAQSILAAVQVVVGAAGFADQVPAAAAWWILTGTAAVQVGLAFYLQGQTTPLSDPQDARGYALVPQDAADRQARQAVREALAAKAPAPPAGPRDLGSTQPGKPFPND